MENTIIKIATDIFKTDIDKDSSMGNPPSWDSMGHLMLFMAIEKEFGVKFAPEEIFETKSIKSIGELLNKKQTNGSK